MTTIESQNIDQLFDEPFYNGTSAVSPLVPRTYQVSIDGHPYVITPAKYQRITVPLQRESTDESVEPGEQTLNVAGAWRRSQDNWFLGAGQEFLDNRFAFVSVYVHSGEDPSVRTRFWRSKGINPWTEGALSLLPEYRRIKTESVTTTALVLYAEKPSGTDGRLVTSSTTTATATHEAAKTFNNDAAWWQLGLAQGGDLEMTESRVLPTLETAALFTSTSVATKQLAGGTWKFAIKARLGAGTVAGTLHARVWRYNAGHWTQIGSDLVQAATLTATAATYVVSGTLPSVTLGSETKLAVDVLWKGSSAPITRTTVYVELGGANFKVTTPGVKSLAPTKGQRCMAVGTTLYYWDGATLYETVNPKATTPAWTAITAPVGTTWPAVQDLTTDGAHLYCALGSHGVAKVTPGSTSATILRPSAPTPSVAAKGTTGSTTYTYALVGKDANGYATLVGTFTTITDGHATLSTTNYNEITWTAVTGIVTWDLLKGTSSHAIATGLTETSFSDAGQGTSAYTAPTSTTDNFQADFLGYGNGFLVGGAANKLVSIAANGSTTAVMTHFNPAWKWNAAAASPVAIYVAGHAGTTSEVYGVQISSTTFGLAAPYIAAQVGQGEVVNAMLYYQGIVALATSIGVRAAQDSGSNGFLTVGAVINDLGGSECLAGFGPYVWFGVSQFDQDDGLWTGTGLSSGTGKLFLSEFSNPLLPAYTTDVMASTGVTGVTKSVTVLKGTPYFTVTGDGIWGPSGNVVSEGFLETGWVRYGTIENKILVAGSVRHTPLLAGQSVQLQIVPFGGQSFSLAASEEAGSIGPPEKVSAGNQVGEAFQIIAVLKRGTDTTQGPTLRRWTCRAMITSVRQDQILCPIIWRDQVVSPIGDGTVLPMTLKNEWQFLKDLETQGAAFTYQEGDLAYTCYIDQIELDPGDGGGWNDTQSMLQGLCLVKMMTVE